MPSGKSGTPSSARKSFWNKKSLGMFVHIKIFSICIPVLGREPSQEGRLWATSRAPVDGAVIAIRAPSCREPSAVRDV
ncbi:hypothetical protein AVEN_156073-1 [Araneus ventricosus]|uniref:Uncharacterized protein n=1 Tax=Araneus ventricosus TaxID=182803 RepID=A0A4Y2TN89_ARAVE|nr:hypothetical protein AVEN_156073-1 [Araneus ventricosus]